MNVGQHCGLIDLPVLYIVAHTADIGFDGAREQLHVLWQITNTFPELPLVPVAQIHEIEADIARCRQDGADQHFAERRFARAGIADDGKRFALFQRKGDTVQDHFLLRRRYEENALNIQASFRIGKAQAWEIER